MLRNYEGYKTELGYGCPTAVASTLLINDTTDYIFFVFKMPATGKLYSISFVTTTVTTGDSAFVVRIEGVDSSGNPDGTLKYTNGEGTVNILDTNDNTNIECLINGSSGVDVVDGDEVAVVLKLSAGSSGNLTIRSSSASARNYPYLGDYNISTGTTITKIAQTPNVCVKIGDRYQCPSGCYFFTGTSGDTAYFESPKERGIGIMFPVTKNLSGFWWYNALYASTSFIVRLYSNPLGSPVLEASTGTQAYAKHASNTIRYSAYEFDTCFKLKKNSLYVLAIAPQDANQLRFRTLPIASALKSAAPLGQYGTLYSRDTTDTTSFTNTDTTVPIMGPIIDGVVTNESIFRGSAFK